MKSALTIAFLLFCCLVRAEILCAQNEAPQLPGILIASSIDDSGQLEVVRYRTIHKGMQGVTRRERSVKSYALTGASFRSVGGDLLSVDQARQKLAQKEESPVLVTSYGKGLAPEYKSLFDRNSLLIVFQDREPFSIYVPTKVVSRKAKRDPLQSVRKITPSMVSKSVTAKPGKFRFVIGAASNLVGLAKDRSDGSFERESLELIESKFKSVINSELDNKVSAQSVAKAIEDISPELKALVGKIEITARWHDDRTETAKAYVIAELDKSSLEAILKTQTKILGGSIGLTAAEQDFLDKNVMSQFNVGWGGNPYTFMIQGFSDPLKTYRP